MAKFILTGFGDEIADALDTQMEVMGGLDIHHIETRGIDGKNIAAYTVEEAKQVIARMKDKGFGVSALGSPFGKIGIKDDFAEHLENFKRSIEVAHAMETRYIRMFSFFTPEDEDPAIYRDEVMARLAKFVEVNKGSGITLLHENEKDIYGEKAARCLDLIESLGSDKLKLVFDPANFIQAQEETWPYAWNMLKPYVVYMHIKDAVAADGHVVPAGYGDGHLREILSDLWNSGYEGFLSLEPHLRNFQGFADLEPNSPINLMEDSCPKWFTMAADSLKKIIAEVAK